MEVDEPAVRAPLNDLMPAAKVQTPANKNLLPLPVPLEPQLPTAACYLSRPFTTREEAASMRDQRAATTENEAAPSLIDKDTSQAATQAMAPLLAAMTPPSNKTAPPALPQIQGWDHGQATMNIDKDQVALWTSIPHDKLFVYPWSASCELNSVTTVVKIRDAIATTLKIPEPIVVPPN